MTLLATLLLACVQAPAPGAAAAWSRAVDTDTDCPVDTSDTDDTGAGLLAPDADEDGFGDADPRTWRPASCAPATYVADRTDCDDTRAQVFPGAVEVVDCRDDDCNGRRDDHVAPGTLWVDGDGDGFGGAPYDPTACSAELAARTVRQPGDCDDLRASVYPGAPETCDGRDDDCDGSVDLTRSEDGLVAFHDGDGDGFGDSARPRARCGDHAGPFTADASDCDDRDATVFPGAQERCDDVDRDCDGDPLGPQPEGRTRRWVDLDGDGLGDPQRPALACPQDPRFSSRPVDCDDGDVTLGAPTAETCNGLDDDCDGQVDEEGCVDRAGACGCATPRGAPLLLLLGPLALGVRRRRREAALSVWHRA